MCVQFRLGKRATNEDFYRRPVIIWAPDLFWNEYCPKLRCPNPECKTPQGHVIPKEWYRRGIRTVHGFDGDWDLVTKRYRCGACDKSFLGTDDNSLATLPLMISQQFPAAITRGGSFHQSLERLTSKLALSKKSRKDVKDLVSKLATERLHRQQQLQHAVRSYQHALQKLQKPRTPAQPPVLPSLKGITAGRPVFMQPPMTARPLLMKARPAKQPLMMLAKVAATTPIGPVKKSPRLMAMASNTAAAPAPAGMKLPWPSPLLLPSAAIQVRPKAPIQRHCTVCGKPRLGHRRGACKVVSVCRS